MLPERRVGGLLDGKAPAVNRRCATGMTGGGHHEALRDYSVPGGLRPGIHNGRAVADLGICPRNALAQIALFAHYAKYRYPCGDTMHYSNKYARILHISICESAQMYANAKVPICRSAQIIGKP